jgi:hypothetical protein
MFVKWFGCDQPTWEPLANTGDSVLDVYNEQGPVTLAEYSAWLERVK